MWQSQTYRGLSYTQIWKKMYRCYTRDYCRIDPKVRPKIEQEIHMGKQTREADAICETEKSTIQDTTGGTSLLATTFGYFNRMGV